MNLQESIRADLNKIAEEKIIEGESTFINKILGKYIFSWDEPTYKDKIQIIPKEELADFVTVDNGYGEEDLENIEALNSGEVWGEYADHKVWWIGGGPIRDGGRGWERDAEGRDSLQTDEKG